MRPRTMLLSLAVVCIGCTPENIPVQRTAPSPGVTNENDLYLNANELMTGAIQLGMTARKPIVEFLDREQERSASWDQLDAALWSNLESFHQANRSTEEQLQNYSPQNDDEAIALQLPLLVGLLEEMSYILWYCSARFDDPIFATAESSVADQRLAFSKWGDAFLRRPHPEQIPPSPATLDAPEAVAKKDFQADNFLFQLALLEGMTSSALKKITAQPVTDASVDTELKPILALYQKGYSLLAWGSALPPEEQRRLWLTARLRFIGSRAEAITLTLSARTEGKEPVFATGVDELHRMIREEIQPLVRMVTEGRKKTFGGVPWDFAK